MIDSQKIIAYGYCEPESAGINFVWILQLYSCKVNVFYKSIISVYVFQWSDTK